MKIIILLTTLLLITGCVEHSKYSDNDRNIVNFTVIDLTKKLIIECENTLTTYQCNDWVENHLNNKYVNWNGIVGDVKEELVYVQYQPKSAIIINNTIYGFPPSIILYDIEKDKLIQLQKGQSIKYIGMIKPEKIEGIFDKNKSYRNWWRSKIEMGKLNLYNSEIEVIE